MEKPDAQAVIRLLVFAPIGVAVLGSVVSYLSGNDDDARFWLSALSSISVITAVVGALYAERYRMWADPIKLALELPNTRNTYPDTHPSFGVVHCHHLGVRNLTPHRAVQNCRVWLEHVLDETEPGKWECLEPFAVPRLMTWAPREFSGEQRTFADVQVFDFGVTKYQDGSFVPTPHTDQGGYVQGYDLRCKSGSRRRYLFRITADNYVSLLHFCAEVSAASTQGKDFIETEIKVVGPTL